jgi:hypothetical protein
MSEHETLRVNFIGGHLDGQSQLSKIGISKILVIPQDANGVFIEPLTIKAYEKGIDGNFYYNPDYVD